MLADPALASDGALLQEYARNKDADAFAELAKRYGGLVYGTCRRVLGDDDDAQDVAQECFLELARKASAVHTSLPAWLHRLARSRSIDAIRRAAARRRAEDGAAQMRNDDSEPTWEELVPFVDEALQNLPERLRVPLILHYLQGHAQVEVAAELDLHQSTVSRQIQAGLAAMREHLRKAGVIVSLAALGVLLADNASTAAPSALAAALGKLAIAGIGAASIAPTYHIGGLIVKKVWLHTAVAALVLIAAAVVTVPRLAATETTGDPVATTSQGAAKKQIEVKAEVFQISSNLAQQLDLKMKMAPNGKDMLAPSTPDPAKLLPKLKKSDEAVEVAAPTISTLDGQPAAISVSGSPKEKFDMSVVPQIKADGNIVLKVKLDVVRQTIQWPSTPALPIVQEMRGFEFGRRAKNGETLVVFGEMWSGTDMLVIFITPKIIN